MSINGQSFDLANGNLFLISTAPGGSVTQLSRDLSALKLTHESIAELAKSDEEIRKFVEKAVPSQ